MLVPFSDIVPLLRAPGRSTVPLTTAQERGVVASVTTADSESTSYLVVAGQPVLIDFETSLVSKDWFLGDRVEYSLVPRKRSWVRRMKASMIGTAGISSRNFRRLRDSLSGDGPRVLMIGAAGQGVGSEILYDDTKVGLIGFDVYPSPLTHFVADAHNIPLADDCVDAVCVQAVLEHVIDPARVVAEIQRVLKPNGLVYAETPFMQQVHEGAYDFTRFTELGHRWLWRDFETIARGPLGGPGLSLYWSAKYFCRGLTRSRKIGDIVSMPFGLFAFADLLMRPTDMVDGANGAFFLGRKHANAINIHSIVGEYLGAN